MIFLGLQSWQENRDENNINFWPIDLADPFFRHQLVSRYSVG